MSSKIRALSSDPEAQRRELAMKVVDKMAFAVNRMTFAVYTALTVEEYGREALEAGTVTYTGDGAPVYEPGDSGVYDLSTESGRRAWKANAPEGVTRTIIEDGEPWLDSVVGMFSEQLADWMEGQGATL